MVGGADDDDAGRRCAGLLVVPSSPRFIVLSGAAAGATLVFAFTAAFLASTRYRIPVTGRAGDG